LEPPLLVGDAQLTQECADHGGTVQVAFQPARQMDKSCTHCSGDRKAAK
jgi:hypothetical protein